MSNLVRTLACVGSRFVGHEGGVSVVPKMQERSVSTREDDTAAKCFGKRLRCHGYLVVQESGKFLECQNVQVHVQASELQQGFQSHHIAAVQSFVNKVSVDKLWRRTNYGVQVSVEHANFALR